MTKKVVYPKCPATVSGKHKWLEHVHDDSPFNDKFSCIPLEHPICEHCGITDDTITLEPKQPEERVAYS